MLKKLKKFKGVILPSLLVVLVAVVGFCFLGNDNKTNLKTKEQLRLLEYNQVKDGEEKIGGVDQITFDAFFMHDLDGDGTAEGIRGTSNHVNENSELWLELKVLGDVTLKDATINFVNSNVKLSGNVVKGSFFKQTINSTNITSIPLSNIGNGTSNLKSLNISSNLTNDITSFSQTNKVILKGVVVDNEGNETPIEKEVSYVADWYYDSIVAYIGSDYSTYYRNNTDAVQVVYEVNTYTKDKVLLKGAYIKGSLTKLNGYDPINVTVNGANVEYTYDKDTQTFEAKREAVLDENIITSQAYSYKNENALYNSWQIVVEYPAEANFDNAAVQVPLTAWFEAYGNQSEGFESIIKSNIASKILVARYDMVIEPGNNHTHALTGVKIGSYSSILKKRYINKTGADKLYEGIEGALEKQIYNVEWDTYLSEYDKSDPLGEVIVKDLGADTIGNVSMAPFAKYKTIRFSYADRYLGSSGYIKLIDNDTEEVIHVFTSLDWNLVYTFEKDVRSIRIETSKFLKNKIDSALNNKDGDVDLLILSTSITKEIDNNVLVANHTYEEFGKFSHVTTQLKTDFHTNKLGWVKERSTQIGIADYITNLSSNVNVGINDKEIEVTEKTDVKITLETGNYFDIVEGWIDGEFLIVLPEQFLDIEVSNVTSSNDKILIVSYETTMIDGKKCIRILTDNDNMASYTLTIDAKLTPDARISTGYYPVKVYAVNPHTGLAENQAQDIYDVDLDNDTNEFVNFGSVSVNLVAPTEMITTTTLTNYDNEGNTTVSPLIAEVNPVEDDSAADVAIGIKNNSGYTVENVKVIGKLGYVGNTYQIGDGDLGSEFDVSMADEGIKVPTELEEKVKVYYSEKETPTDDITNDENGWTETPTDFSKVKTYMILIEDYSMQNGENLEFTYGIEMPNKTENLFKTTYFTHGVYYDVVTNAGTYASSVGGSKLGITMARKYDLDITNLKTNTQRGVYARYLLTDSEGNQKVISTNNLGKVKTEDLYVGLEYTLKQITVKSSYELDEEVKTFKVENGANDELVLTNTGTYKSINYNTNNILEMILETEPRYTITLKNTDLDTTESIEGTVFKLTGKGCEDGCILNTNIEGLVTLKGLYLNEEYILEEVKSQNHLRNLEPFKIKLVRNEETGEVAITVVTLPVVGEIQNITNGFEYNSSGELVPIVKESDTYNQSVIPIDLSTLKENYKLTIKFYMSFNTSNRTGYFNAHLVNKYNADDYNNGYYTMPFVSISNRYLSSTVSTTTAMNVVNGTTATMEFKGGNNYDLFLDMYCGNSCYSGNSINSIKIENVNGNIEQVIRKEKENVYAPNTPNILQTIKDSDQIDSPELTVEVKSKKIPTYTLELTKKDAESGEVLSGAQYKITGPGLPTNGKYITTDENGKATIELIKKYNYDKVNNVDYTQVENEYTIEEVVAPVGYMLDNKSITFNNTMYIINLSNGLSKDNVIDKIDYATNTESKFKEAEYDSTTNTYKVVMEDYPIVTIKKTDAETNEILPNTLFAIYNVGKTGGIEVLTPAKDVNGNIIGNEITINGKTIFVVSTDENGKINLNLSSGKYKLIEVQANDEKYEIDDQEYYFGVGETVPYSAGGLELSGVIMPEQYTVNSTSGSNSTIATKDGGWITTSGDKIIKYMADGAIAWEKELLIPLQYTAYAYYYFDNPDRSEVTYPYNPSYLQPSTIIESSDGGYFIRTKYNPIFVKVDENGNILWHNEKSTYYLEYQFDHYCTYEGNTNVNGEVAEYRYDETNGEWVPNRKWIKDEATGQYGYYGDIVYKKLEEYMKRDDETYYCHQKSLSSYYNTFGENYGKIASTPDGGALMMVRGYTGNDYKIKLSDGTFKPMNNPLQLLRYDKDGNLIDAIDLTERYNQLSQAYYEKYSIASTESGIGSNSIEHSYLGTYPNGDVLVVMQADRAFKLSYNEETDSYDNLWFTPLGVNSFEFSNGRLYSYGDGELPVQLTEDGGFGVHPYNQTYMSKNNTNINYSGDNLKINPESMINDWEYYPYNDSYGYNENSTRVLKFTETTEDNGDKQATIVSATILETTWRNIEEVVKYGNSDFKKLYHSGGGGSSGLSSYMLDDGSYIVSEKYRNQSLSEYYRKVELTDGTTIVIDPSTDFIVYKVTPDSQVEWIKQYSNISEFSQTPKIRLSANGTKMLIPVKLKANSTLTELGNDNIPVITNESSSDKLAFLIFDVNQEVTPEGPEAYTLNINNSRKEYNVSVTSNIGSNVKVTDGGKTIYEGLPETDVVVEKVKYNDDNIYDIKITPEDGYVITSVKVNGEDIGYTVNDDLSITLDKIKEITEDKEIVVTMAPGLSSVVVHHYKENTSERVFSDEIINGMILSKYETAPQVSNLYSLITDENGEYILPENMTGTFEVKPIEVTYYYKENNVDLKVNYYINDTEIELAPSLIETKVLGAKYQTSALDIEFYEIAKVIGEEEGTLDSDLTEVTYFYNEVTESEITVKHIDKDTSKEIAESERFIVDRHADYETKESDKKPANYRYVSRTSNAVGKAETTKIEVIYYYEVIPFDVEVDTKISEIIINGEKTDTGDGKLAKIEPEKEDNVIVYYEIKVKNTGDIKATMKIEQSEIEGFEIYDLKEFTKEEDKYIVNVELEAGEEKTYKIGYKWDQDRYGESDSETKISEVANSLGFEEPDNENNISTTKIIVGVPTGMNFNILSIIIGSIMISASIVFMILRRRVRN